MSHPRVDIRRYHGIDGRNSEAECRVTRTPPAGAAHTWGHRCGASTGGEHSTKLRLTHRELLGSGPARAQGTRLSRPQAEHLEQARSYHGIEGRIFEASGHVTRTPLAGAAHRCGASTGGERSSEAAAHAPRAARLGARESARDSLEPSAGGTSRASTELPRHRESNFRGQWSRYSLTRCRHSPRLRPPRAARCRLGALDSARDSLEPSAGGTSQASTVRARRRVSEVWGQWSRYSLTLCRGSPRLRPQKWSLSGWGSARQRLRHPYCELLVGGSRPAIAQGTHLSHPQAGRLK